MSVDVLPARQEAGKLGGVDGLDLLEKMRERED